MTDLSPRLSLPYLQPSQAQKHVTHNEALERLDALVQLSVARFGAGAPPGQPVAGEIHALGPAPTGDWAGQGGKLAIRGETAWQFVAPQEGWRAWGVQEQELRVYSGGSWVPQLQNLDGLGIGTTSNATNPLAVAADASLFSNAGTDHRMKINKAGAGDTAALLFQSGWTGHAEMGLAGDTRFSVKVSADGSAWQEALAIDPGTQSVSLAPAGVERLRLDDAGMALDVPLSGTAVQASATDTTAGRLALAQHAYGPGNLLGTVAQAAGIPTGAVIERGANVNGQYVRFADGTQVCWNEFKETNLAVTSAYGSLYRSGTITAPTFPAAFATAGGLVTMFRGSFATNIDGWLVANGTPTTTALTTGALRAMSAVSRTSDFLWHYVAIGRWFA